MTIKLRIEGDRILTDTGVEVGHRDPHGRLHLWHEEEAGPEHHDGYYTIEEATDYYNAHLREVLGDRVVVSREDAGVCVKALDLAAAIMNSINGTLDDNGTMALRGIANKIRAMLKEADHD